MAAVVMIWAAGASPGQTTPLLEARYVEAILREISGDIAKQHIHMMAPYERNRPDSEYSGDFLETAYMSDRLRAYGIPGAAEKIESGAELWKGDFGELWMEEPARERLANFEEVAASLIRGSGCVDVRAELVSVGQGKRKQDYAGKNVRGKIVLTTSPMDAVYPLAIVERGAAGVISYDASPGQHFPKHVKWQNVLKARDGLKTVPSAFGFAVSSLAGARLERLLDEGKKVVLHAKTETRKLPGRLDAVTAELPAQAFPGDGLLFLAHLFEGVAKQGANDNLSGPAVELEVARTLMKLRKGQLLPEFRRPIRFLWTQEITGTTAYFDKYPEAARALRAAINMDMVGEGLVQERGIFHVAATPHSQPHFLNDVVRAVAEMTIAMINDANGRFPGNVYGQYANKVVSPTGSDDVFWCDFLPFDGGSDNVPLNRAEYNIPTVYYEVWPDFSHHTNEDVAARSDATQLKRVAFMAAVTAAVYATATPRTVVDALPEFLTRSRVRIAEELRRAGGLLAASSDTELPEARRLAELILTEAHEREALSIETLVTLTRDSTTVTEQIRDEAARIRADLAQSLEALRRLHRSQCQLRNVPETVAPKPALEKEMEAVRPIRVKRDEGPAGLPEKNTVLSTRYAAYELYNFMENRSIAGIWRKLYAEFGSVTLGDVRDYIMAHVKGGDIRLASMP